MSHRRRPEPQPKAKSDLRWDFFSFPVAYGFAAGAFIALLLSGLFQTLQVFLIVSLFGFSFGNAHILTTWWRTRTLDQRREREEEDEKERRALAARAAASLANDGSVRRRRRRGGKASGF